MLPHREALEHVKVNVFKHRDMRRFENYLWRHIRVICLDPAGQTQAPLIAFAETKETILRRRCRKIIACAFAEGKKIVGDAYAYRTEG